jgi:hypothetical protein
MAVGSNLLTRVLFLLTIWANVLTFSISDCSSFRKFKVENVLLKLYL